MTLTLLFLLSACNVRRDHALIDAAEAGEMATVERQISAGANVNARDKRREVLGIVIGSTPLTEASANGHTAIVTRLLDAEADPNLADGAGWRPLAYAATEGHPEVVTILLSRGADVDGTNELGRTALWELAGSYEPRLDIIELLVTAGASPDHADQDGVTPRTRAERDPNRVALLPPQ